MPELSGFSGSIQCGTSQVPFYFFIRSFEVSCWLSMLANFLLLIKIHVVWVLQEHFESFQGQWVIKSRDLFLQVPKALGLGPQPLQKWKHIWENWEVEPIQNQSVGKRHQKGQAFGWIVNNGFWACTQGWIQGIWKTQGDLLTTPFNTCLHHLSRRHLQITHKSVFSEVR